jgi:hypothetical protein
MKITRDNYEQYFLDYAEGNLSPEMEEELSYFLKENPDLKSLLEDFDHSPVPDDEVIVNPIKKNLKKYIIPTVHISEDNVDEWMIRDLEGLLNGSEENELKEFLSLNPAYSFDYKIFWHTKLSPDLSVSYRNKKELKKKTARFPVIRLTWLIPAVAAMVLLFISIRHFTRPQINVDHQVVPAIATLPPLPSPEIASLEKRSSQIKKQVVDTGTPSPERANTSKIKPISTKEIIIHNPTNTKSLDLACFEYSPIQADGKKDRSLVGKVVNNMLAQAREGLGSRAKTVKAGKSDFSFWSIAKAGINGFNSMSDRELELYVRKDESGKVKSYALVEEERLILSKELNKN